MRTIAFTAFKTSTTYSCLNQKGLPPSIYFYDFSAMKGQEDDTKISGGFSVLKYDDTSNEVMYLTHSEYAAWEGAGKSNIKNAAKNLVPN